MIRRTLPPLAAAAVLALGACSSDDATTGESTPDTTPSADAAPATTEEPAVEATTTTSEAPETTTSTTEAPETTTTTTVADAGAEVQPFGEQPDGTNLLISTQSFADTVAAATAAIEGNENLTLVATVDHAANAETVGLELPSTTELIFGNPALGTPLMQENNGVGLDLPQKMLVMEDADGTVRVLWNDPTYLASRYGLGPASIETLATIDGALLTLGQAAAATDEETAYAFPTIGPGEGIVTVEASGTAREAADRLLAAIEGNEALRLVAEVDHGANAAGAGLELPPTIEVIFGNPNLGTPLMRESRTIALDLPQKMLFVETADGVTITYNDSAELAQRHDIDSGAEPVPMISGALEMLAAAAAG